MPPRIEEERIDDDLPGLLFNEKEEMQNSTGVIWIFYGDDREDRIESGVVWRKLDNKLTCRASFSPPIIGIAEMIKYKLSLHTITKISRSSLFNYIKL